MNLLYLRHGQTDWNALHLIQGKTDIPLNETGREQAHAAADSLASYGIDLIIASPLKRAMETAEIIAERLGIDRGRIVSDASLCERDFGIYEGRPMSEVDMDALRHWTDDAPTPGGETIRDVAGRVFGFMDAALEKHKGKTMLLVAHGHVLRVLYWYFHGIPAQGEEETMIRTDNCALYEFDTAMQKERHR